MRQKHIQISQEQAKLYSHYYNKRKCCPNSLGCVFLHEESDICKYNELCERNLCMYKHDTAVDCEETGDVNEEPDQETMM